MEESVGERSVCRVYGNTRKDYSLLYVYRERHKSVERANKGLSFHCPARFSATGSAPPWSICGYPCLVAVENPMI